MAYYGGAISSENALVTSIQLENNLFVGNFAYHGGAIYKNDTRRDFCEILLISL